MTDDQIVTTSQHAGNADPPEGRVAATMRETLLFLLGTFAWAWALWGYWAVAMPPGGLQVTAPFILCAIVGGFAPSLAAIAVSWRSGGPEEATILLRGLLRWRIGAGSYAAALLLVPTIAILSAIVQSHLVGPLKWADPSLLVMAFIWPLMAALGEEIGWRGFLLPRLQSWFGLLPAALIVGLLWGLWHLPADYVALKGYRTWFWLAFMVNGPVVLSGHSVIMTWLWKRTGGSLLAAVLYHLSITASAIAVPNAGSDGPSGLVAACLGAAFVWIVAVYLLLARRSDLADGVGQIAPPWNLAPSGSTSAGAARLQRGAVDHAD